jgi:hypothetical protein
LKSLADNIPFVTITIPSFPTAALTNITQPAPPAQLALGDLTGTGYTGSATASGSNWLVTLTNSAIGADKNFNLPVRFTPPGLAAQSGTKAVVVQPATYAVATVTVTSPNSSVGVQSTQQLSFTA